MNCPNQTDIAYLAGVLDSDGSIFLSYQNKKKTTIRSVISVTNRDLGMLNWIRKTFATGWNSTNPKQPRCRNVFQFQIGSRKNVTYILKLVLPYLKSKNIQAKLVLDFCTNHKNGIYTKREWEIFREVKNLNKRGD